MLNIILTPFPTLTTERLVLRKFNESDANQIMALRSDKSVNAFIDRQAPANMEEVKAFINKIETGISNNELFYWAITLKDDNILIGTICLFKISKENYQAEIGYELLPAFQGKGIMKEAVTKIIDFGFSKVNFKVIVALIKHGNERSIQIVSKNNFLPDNNHEFVNETEGLTAYYLLRPE